MKPACFWCGGGNGGRPLTRDHLIPVWACRAFRELRTEHDTIEGPSRVVKACARCNHDKGGMPPERFYHLRLDLAARKKEALRWQQIQRTVILNPTALSDALKAQIIEAMLKPVPNFNPAPAKWTSPPPLKHSKNKPLKRLYTMEDARQWDEDRYAR